MSKQRLNSWIGYTYILVLFFVVFKANSCLFAMRSINVCLRQLQNEKNARFVEMNMQIGCFYLVAIYTVVLVAAICTVALLEESLNLSFKYQK